MKLNSTLHHFVFHNTKLDPSLFVRFSHSPIYLLVYIDDILVISADLVEISRLISQLHSVFALKDLGEMHYFLGIEASKSSSGVIHFSQAKYVKDLLKRAGVTDAKPMPTPMFSNLKSSAHGVGSFANPTLYRSIVGGLQYATITRSNIAFFMNKVS